MDLLDVGCGPATITLGLAQAVAPGQVVGIDRDPGQVERSRAYVAERGASNVRIEVADVYELPFPDGSFDAAFAHVVFLHLSDPVRALREIRRVLRPGGVVGLRDPDFGTIIQSPANATLDDFRAMRARAQAFHGANPMVAREYRRLLLEAGFAGSEAGASVRSAGNATECQEVAAFINAQLSGVGATALAEGWADQAKLDEMRGAVDAWARRADAFYVVVSCHVVGRA